MTTARSSCRERIAPSTLAAWRDGTLSTAEAARIAAHVPGCSACRAELATYEALDAALRHVPAPEPDGRLWRAVASNLTDERRQQRHPGISARRLASGLVALAAVLLLGLGFAQVLNSRSTSVTNARATATASSGSQGTPTPLPTAQPASPAIDGSHINWQQARLPFEPLTNRDILTYAIVPGHGESAYVCHGISDQNGGTLTFYRTTDRAQHWTTLKQLSAPQIDLSDCLVQVDILNANRVLVEVFGQNMQTSTQATWYEVTEDGGTTWTRLDDPVATFEPTTLNGKTYALRRQTVDQNHVIQTLAVSVDNLHTWRSIDQQFVGPYQGVSNFWLNPDGELLAEVTVATPPATSSGATPTPSITWDQVATLWHSSDGGVHWEAFPAPARAKTFVVGRPVASHPWNICAQYLVGPSKVPNLACTFDGGRTWSARPALCTVAPCKPGPVGGYSFSIANDGVLILMSVAPGSDSQLGLYRLPQGATRWQYLGPTSGSNAFFYAPTQDGGILWAYAGGTYSNVQLGGIIGGQQTLPGVLSTATYS